MGEFAQLALVTFTSILFLVDPIAPVPTFLAITQGDTADLCGERRTPARVTVVHASIVSTLLISWMMLRVGDRVMSRFGQMASA